MRNIPFQVTRNGTVIETWLLFCNLHFLSHNNSIYGDVPYTRRFIGWSTVLVSRYEQTSSTRTFRFQFTIGDMYHCMQENVAFDMNRISLCDIAVIPMWPVRYFCMRLVLTIVYRLLRLCCESCLNLVGCE